MSIKPITPDQIVEKLQEAIEPFVIKAVNELIAENWTGSSATFRVSALRAKIQSNQAADTLPIKNYRLNFEPIYRKAGWKVDCDRPGYNESYETNWTFTKKKNDE